MNFPTVDDYAKKLKWSKNKIYELIDQGLPAIKNGERGTRIIEDEADKWIIENYKIKRKTNGQRVAKLIEI